MAKKQKLELTWTGKGDDPRLEPRILIEDLTRSYGDKTSKNLLIHGDNLLALKALEQEYSGKIKCIYIDPPYNTGNAFKYYDDGLEHSIWLELMYERLLILEKLLTPDGTIFVQLDDNEQAYLKVMMDEIFGRSNYLNVISVKTKASSGASGGGEDKKLKKNVEYLTVYSKSDKFDKFKDQYNAVPLQKYIDDLKQEGKSFAYSSVLVDEGKKEYHTSTVDGRGDEIKIFKHNAYVIKSVKQLAKEENVDEANIYSKYFQKIFTLENAQTSIRQRVIDVTDLDDTFYSIEYVPVSGKNKGKLTVVTFIGKTKRLLSYLENTCVQTKGGVYKKLKVGTLWDDLSWSAISFEGGVDFPNGKKPETLLRRILEMSTDPGDFILDSFLGSGTTTAAAHKMGRSWIGIELGDHAYTHCQPRLKKIIDGDDLSGISKVVGWKGGGGFKFLELAPSLLEQDSFGNWIISQNYDANMLAHAMAKQEGFTYAPSQTIYWQQGLSTENDYIYTTTQYVSIELLDSIYNELQDDQSLLIACKAFDSECRERFNNITIKKIPQILLGRCEFGQNDYSLNIVEVADEEPSKVNKE